MAQVGGIGLEVVAPAELADIIAAFISDGALVVSTRVTGEGEKAPAVRSIVYPDGDLTIRITPNCLCHPARGELFARHDQEMQRIGRMLRRASGWVAAMIALTGAAGTATAAAVAVVAGASWLHTLAAAGGVGATVSGITWLGGWIGRWFVVRKVRRALGSIRTASVGRSAPL